MAEEKIVLELPELLRKNGYFREFEKMKIRFKILRMVEEVKRGNERK